MTVLPLCQLLLLLVVVMVMVVVVRHIPWLVLLMVLQVVGPEESPAKPAATAGS
jgi:hypothetical protein